MWVMTKNGFLSVVEHNEDSATLLVRARVRGDIEEIRERFIPAMGEPFTVAWSDYPWRAIVPREAFAAGMAAMVGAIDYANFKKSVMKEQGPRRENVYARVWSVLQDLENLN